MKLLKILFAIIVSLFILSIISPVIGAKCKRINGYITCKPEEKISYVKQLAVIERKACTCPDKNCAETVLKDFLAVVGDMKETNAQVSTEESKKLETSTTNIVNCLMFNGIEAITIQEEMAKFK